MYYQMESTRLLDGLATLMSLDTHTQSRGRLLPLEFGQLPFHPVRSFVIDNVPLGAIRGQHAHKSCTQLLICLNGKISVNLQHASQKACVELLPNCVALMIKPLVYSEQVYLEEGSILLVLADTPYDPESYILKDKPDL